MDQLLSQAEDSKNLVLSLLPTDWETWRQAILPTTIDQQFVAILLGLVLCVFLVLALAIRRKRAKVAAEEERLHKMIMARRRSMKRRKSVMSVDQVKRFAALLSQGAEMVKFGRHGKPHKCTVTWNSETGVITWGSKKGNSIQVKDIVQVTPGKHSTTLLSSKNRSKADSDLCFSITTDKRTLDLQASEIKEKEDWVEGLRGLAEGKHHFLQR